MKHLYWPSWKYPVPEQVCIPVVVRFKQKSMILIGQTCNECELCDVFWIFDLPSQIDLETNQTISFNLKWFKMMALRWYRPGHGELVKWEDESYCLVKFFFFSLKSKNKKLKPLIFWLFFFQVCIKKNTKVLRQLHAAFTLRWEVEFGISSSWKEKWAGNEHLHKSNIECQKLL